jgi:uncharacterized protein YdaU (DUF1376 family)
MTGKLPYLPLYFGDFLASTAEWDGEARALYLLLLGHQWSIGSLPDDPARICKLAGWDPKVFAKHWPEVAAKFERREGRLCNPRLEQHRTKSAEIAKVRAEVGRRGGLAKAATPKEANGKQLPSNSQTVATANSCHPNQSNPNQELRGSSVPSSEGDLSPVLPSTAPRTAQRAHENRRALASLTAATLKQVPR